MEHRPGPGCEVYDVSAGLRYCRTCACLMVDLAAHKRHVLETSGRLRQTLPDEAYLLAVVQGFKAGLEETQPTWEVNFIHVTGVGNAPAPSTN